MGLTQDVWLWRGPVRLKAVTRAERCYVYCRNKRLLDSEENCASWSTSTDFYVHSQLLLAVSLPGSWVQKKANALFSVIRNC